MEKLRKVIFFIALLVFLGSAGYLGTYFIKGQIAESDFKELRVEHGHDLEALHAENADIVGWIQIDGTKVDYPVMQTKDDPEFYLRRNFQKEYSDPGTPFLDADSDLETSRHWVIYGHNMKSGSMFHDIVQYEEPEFYEQHKTFRFDTLRDGNALYEVVAAGRTKIFNVDDQVFKYYQYPFIDTEEVYDEYVEGVKSLSAVDTGVTPHFEEDQLITLSTCEYHDEEGRFIVVARKLKDLPEDGAGAEE